MTLWIFGQVDSVRSTLATRAKELGQDIVLRQDVPLQNWYMQQDPLTLSRSSVARQSLSELDLTDEDSVIVLLGLQRAPTPGSLTASAAAINAMEPKRLVWVNRLRIGFSARKVPRVAHWILEARMAHSLKDRMDSDALVLDAGATVLHTHAPSRPRRRQRRDAQPFARDQTRVFPRRPTPEDVARMALELISESSLPGIYLAR